ncbi:lipase maturation factor 2-like [Bacillus rossius redtenbacheri]|uniref:lipase maturation factor 2-like n=1 Tax=Bacillus rossius redtenbacheri TaxID=93214 RepID=UPI002FDDA947
MAQIRYTRNLFLRGVCVVYLFAFASFYVQIPGLYGNDGVLPAKNQLDSKAKTLSARVQSKPTLLWLAPYVGLDTEYMMDVLALLGIFLAFTGFVSQKFCTAPMFAGLWSLYFSLYQVGQTFMWFQWDILLLEAGFLCVLAAPFRYQLQARRRTVSVSPRDLVSFWLVRWLLFRLMFSSGVVKLTSGCPTWWGLTALTVHFESQCIPTPLAWYAHHLPTWLLKLSTVYANVAEIALPILFFFPLRTVRITGFYLQVLLQVCIILTGNYNFFNLLTICLCVSLLDDEYFNIKRPQSVSVRWWKVFSIFVNLVIHAAVIYGTIVLFNIRWSPKNFLDMDISFTKQQFDKALGLAVPAMVYVGLISLTMTVFEAVVQSLVEPKGPAKIFTFLTTAFCTGAALFIFGISIVPFSTLHASGNSTVVPALREWHGHLDHLHLANSYGLFRRMTGVGGRPEVIIEGSNHLEGPWKEYNFLYKPGNVNSTPPFVAPHQPRLDWQMWFAALGTYHQNPWLMSLTYRLLTAQPEVLRLLDQSRSPFPDNPPKYIKGSLYHYRYTPWNHRSTRVWWTRERVGEYFPVFSRDHPPLLDYLRSVKILTDDAPKAFPAPAVKAALDTLRQVTQVEASILLWSLFAAGWAIIATRSLSQRR